MFESISTVTTPDGKSHKLGCIIVKTAFDYGQFRVIDTPDGRRKLVPRFGAFYHSDYDKAPPPLQVDYWTKALPAVKQMDKNDQLGDCCIAMMAHTVGLWTGNELGAPAMSVDSTIAGTYHHICGPGDNGCVVTDVMDAWKQGVQIGDGLVHKIDDYVAIDWTNKQLVQVALDIFGGIELAVDLPSAWTGSSPIWDVTSTRTVGGHCIPGGSYGASLSNAAGSPFNSDGVSISTWGGLRLITWPAFNSKKYITEAYIPLSPDWYSKSNLAPNGVDVAGLQAAFAAIKSGQVPDVPTPPPVTPPWFV